MYADERNSHSEGKRYEKTDTTLRFQGFRGSHKRSPEKEGREPQQGQQRPLYLPALPCEYRKQRAAPQPAGVLRSCHPV